MARNRTAPVWLHGQLVGQITSPSPRSPKLRFTYSADALERYPLNTPLLSCSLPTGARTMDGRPFFAGLLPEGDHRRALAARAGVLTTDVFALLVAYGQDVAGAVVIGDAVAARPDAAAEPYLADGLADEVADLASKARPLAVHDDSELSIAGLQDKMLLVALPDGGWGRPVHGYPSTHILKIDDRTHRGLVVAEHTCLQIARAAGLPAAESELVAFGDLDALIVTRFDRDERGTGLPARIHQEDACQALGIDLETGDGKSKYQQHGGPGLREVAGLLEAWAGHQSLDDLLDQAVFTVLTANSDAHGKNISFLHPAPDRIALAPLYDTVPTALWPSLRTRAAMTIGAATELPQIDVGDLVREADSWGMSRGSAHARILDVVQRVRAACDYVTTTDVEMARDAVRLVRGNCERLLQTAQ